MQTYKLSIIIVNFETFEYTSECIDSIYKNPPSCLYEIILIDNGSQDASLEKIQEKFPEVKCIRIGENLGFSLANNLGIQNARGELVLLLNSDTKILNGSLNRIVEYLNDNPSVGVVAPRQIDGTGRIQFSWGGFPTFISEFYRKIVHYRLSIDDPKIRDYLEEKCNAICEVDWVSGSCLLVRKKALFDVGLFDKNFFMYFEDIDLCRKIKDSGWQINYNPNATILHYGGVSAKKNILHVLVEYRRSQIYFTRKYYGTLGVIFLKLLLFAKYGFYFIRWGMVYIIEKLSSKVSSETFAKLLLSKKAIGLIFER